MTNKPNWNLTFFLAILGSVYKILQKKKNENET